MKIPKLKASWLVGLIGGLFFLVIVPMYLPLNPGMKKLSLLLYFYILIEISLQINISRKRNKEAKLQNKQKSNEH